MLSVFLTVLGTILITCIIGIAFVLVGGATITLGWILWVGLKVFLVYSLVLFTVKVTLKLLR